MSEYADALVDSSRLLADILTADIGSDPSKFEAMFSVCIRDEYPQSMRAARVLALSALNYPQLVTVNVDRIISAIETCKTIGVRRSLLKILADWPYLFSEKQFGLLIDFCFSVLGDPNQAIALRIYAIDILVKSIRIYPELKLELVVILEGMEFDESVGIRSKSRKLLKTLRNQK